MVKCEISDNDDNINFLGQVIGLKNKAAAKFNFSGDITPDMCTVNDKQIAAEDLCSDENGTYIIIRDISPDNYDRPFKITVGNVTINNASVFSCLYSALNGKRTELYDIVYAVYAFNKAAGTYSAQIALNSAE
ncbi:MAG: hypothetical protein ACI4KM_11885 [Oscillospiraceae bacterium]